MEKKMTEVLERQRTAEFPCMDCCAKNRCADCRYMEMDNDAYNDGTRRCAWRGEWLSPATEACWKFTW